MFFIVKFVLLLTIISSGVALSEDEGNEIQDTDSALESPVQSDNSVDTDGPSTDADTQNRAAEASMQIESSNSISVTGEGNERSSVESFFEKIIHKVPKKHRPFADYRTDDSEEDKFNKLSARFRHHQNRIRSRIDFKNKFGSSNSFRHGATTFRPKKIFNPMFMT